MKTGKIIFALVLGLCVAQKGLAQVHEEVSYPEKTDPIVVQLFPNPATEYLTIKLESPHARKLKVTLHTIIGTTLEVESEILDDFELRLKVKDFPSGYYLIALQDDEAHFKNTFKFLKR